MRRFLCVLSVVLLCVLSPALNGCGEEESAEALLWSLLGEASSLPKGEVYLSRAEEGEVGFLSSELVVRMYGEGGEALMKIAEEIALFLPSFPQPAELAVITCYSATDAYEAEAVLRARLEHLTVAFFGTEWEATVRGARVAVEGRRVFFLLAEEAEELERLARRLC